MSVSEKIAERDLRERKHALFGSLEEYERFAKKWVQVCCEKNPKSVNRTEAKNVGGCNEKNNE